MMLWSIVDRIIRDNDNDDDDDDDDDEGYTTEVAS